MNRKDTASLTLAGLISLTLIGCNPDSSSSPPTADTLDCGGGVCTLDSGARIAAAEAKVIEHKLSQGNVILTTSDSDALTLVSPVKWSSNHSLTLQATNDLNIFAEITATRGKLIFDNVGHDYHLRKPIILSAGQNFSVNGTDYVVITQLGAEGSLTGTDLQGIAGNIGANYALGADIDAASTSTWNGGAGFQPLLNSVTEQAFSGTFAGLGHVISNLTINRPSNGYVGLFATLADQATVRNLALENFDITAAAYAGALAGYSYGEVVILESCVVGADITLPPDADTGSFVGRLDDDLTITDSCALGSKLTAKDNIGGLVGNQVGALSVDKSYAFRLNINDTDGSAEHIGYVSGKQTGSLLSISNTLVNYQTANEVPSTPNGATSLRLVNLGELSHYQNVSWDISTDANSDSLWFLDQSDIAPLPAMLRIFDLDLSDYLYIS